MHGKGYRWMSNDIPHICRLVEEESRYLEVIQFEAQYIQQS